MTHQRSLRGTCARRRESRRPWATLGRGRGREHRYERYLKLCLDLAALRSSPDQGYFEWHGRKAIQQLTRQCFARMLPRYLIGWMVDGLKLVMLTVMEMLLVYNANALGIDSLWLSVGYRAVHCSRWKAPLHTRILKGRSRMLSARDHRTGAGCLADH